MTLMLFSSGSLEAKKKKSKRHHNVAGAVYSPGKSSFVMDADTGNILHTDNPHAQRHPASLTKMQTLYILFEALENGEISINDRFVFSKHASKQSPSKLYLKPGESISVKDAILALVTKSANDVAVAVAEGVSGSEAAFVARMNRTARQLGMNNTTFKNANGWHNKEQKTTAHDMAVLLHAIIKDYPRYYKYFGTKSFVFRGVQHPNHNKLLGKYDGMDGGKTGFTCPSGFNLAASAVRSGRRLVAVVMGGTSSYARNNQMVQLLDTSFERIDNNYEQPEIAAEVAAPQEVIAPQKVVRPQIRPISMSRSIPVPQYKPVFNKVKTLTKQPKGDWGIQVGAYSKLHAARDRANEVKSMFNKLESADVEVNSVTRKSKKRKLQKLYQARISNLPKAQAQKVCSVLKSKKQECMVYQK